MSQEANTIPPKGFGKLQFSDFVKSILLAAGANALISLYTIIQSGSWPTSEDWKDILQATVAFIISYIVKNLFTNNTGKFLKKDEPVVVVPAKELEKVIDFAAEGKKF